MESQDLTYNPYDFANPVSDAYLFVGREDEMQEITYYLNQARSAPRPISIALLGQRASGKTSVLNMTALEAHARDFCVVRVDLDEGDVTSQMAFFQKLFHEILTAACELGAYGGIGDRTYDTYLDIVYAYTIPDDKIFCPFLFPLVYARAMAGRNENAIVPDNAIRRDLSLIRSQLGRPIIILFDEGNVLGSSKVILEKLRNTLAAIPGFMAVITGTPDLLTLLDDVFSPIVRQFVKIHVGQFEDESATEACIRRPLEKIGMRPEDIFDFETYSDVSEIHDLSGGRPYEIQLICHMLFRRVQTKRAKKMQLDLSVLEDVRKEIEASRDPTSRPIWTKIRGVNKQRLSTLRLLCACDGLATLDQLWSVEYLINDEKSWTLTELQEALQRFSDDGILECTDGIIKFKGDELDKVFVKYFAREQGVAVSLNDMPIEAFWAVRLSVLLGRRLGRLSAVLADMDLDITSVAAMLAANDPQHDSFVEFPALSDDVYTIMMAYRERASVPLAAIKLILPWFKSRAWFFPRQQAEEQKIDEAVAKLELVPARALEIGGSAQVEKIELTTIPAEVLISQAERTSNERMKKRLTDFHVEQAYAAYVSEDDLDGALFHVNAACKLDPVPTGRHATILGYLFLTADDLDRSKAILSHAIETALKADKPDLQLALTQYNLGVVESQLGNLHEACSRFEASLKTIERQTDMDTDCACLWVPQNAEGALQFVELRDVQLDQIAANALATVREIMSDAERSSD